ncbi:hypothetical protein RIR_jg27845.t1 [Rhizophagus irregularis DAOM 181602=DAOM 197198]|nr:hypothetical protein RIR_jg27845.t1 [Rhizophagus irregularis DAOM 181602=DAOM 197198]
MRCNAGCAFLINALADNSDLLTILETADCPNPICDLANSQISSAAICCVIPLKEFYTFEMLQQIHLLLFDPLVILLFLSIVQWDHHL